MIDNSDEECFPEGYNGARHGIQEISENDAEVLDCGLEKVDPKDIAKMFRRIYTDKYGDYLK